MPGETPFPQMAFNPHGLACSGQTVSLLFLTYYLVMPVSSSGQKLINDHRQSGAAPCLCRLVALMPRFGYPIAVILICGYLRRADGIVEKTG